MFNTKLQLNDLQLSPYFPDGTLCHTEGGNNYYCQRHMCLSKDSRVARQDTPDLDINMNAPPKSEDVSLPENLSKYFTLDKNFQQMPGVSLDF